MQALSAAKIIQPVMAMLRDGYEYWYDTVQRSILFGDIMRKRGNAYLDHLKQGQPPVLAFDYETILDGRKAEQPVNYKLVQVFDRREQKEDAPGAERRWKGEDGKIYYHDPRKRPIVVMDPRAGHGPGIGGSKMDSQIGLALSEGHPVYFIMFLVSPVKGQTIADVQRCQIRFLEEIKNRHPDAHKPAVIGNCQAGWAAALIAADRPDVAGPLVLNGSPLSYWGGVRGANPMRYRGGLFGGSWLASLASDLGNGQFDGANLVTGFEALNAANTFWSKQYNVYAGVDTEENRYLDFEKWWGGFFMLSREEIRFIVNNLFISDELEQGFLKLRDGAYINLKNFKDPIVVFASKGDNITPPQQALNWITKVYGSVEDIKQNGQTIVYLLHDSIGHLGIFVSSTVVRKEHKEIIGCMDAIEFLAPGLYEMVIREGPSKPWLSDHRVAFMERTMADILALDDGFEDEEAFYPVASISWLNDHIYRDCISPWVRLFSNEFTAEVIRQAHPLRVQRYGLSDLNPFMRPLQPLARMVKDFRSPAEPDNVFVCLEKLGSGLIVNSLELFQKNSDTMMEGMFYTLYGNYWIKQLFYYDDDRNRNMAKSETTGQKHSPLFKKLEDQLWHKAMTTGGFEAAVIRIILAVTNANHLFGMAEYSTMRSDERLRELTPKQLKHMVKDQSAILEKDRDQALETLPILIPDENDRLAAVEVARTIADIDTVKKFRKTALFRRIEDLLTNEKAPAYAFSS